MTIVIMITAGGTDASATPRPPDLAALLTPRSIAIVGASPGVERHTGRAMANLLRTGYTGALYPVNPKYDQIDGIRCLPSVADLPTDVDVAYVLVRSDAVAGVVEECVRAGVGNVVVCTSGFAEEGAAGGAMQSELTDIAARTGVRIVGPNCIGMLDVPANVIAVPTLNIAPRLDPGHLTVVSQSGGMGVNVVNLAQARGIGVRALASVGNECDVDVADLVAAFAGDEQTHVIALFLEQVRRPRAFLAAAAAAQAAGKRMVVLKVGASAAAERSSLGHTGAMTGSHAAFTTVMNEIGVAVAPSLDGLVDLAGLLLKRHRPASNRLLIVSPSGGECSYAADRAQAAGLAVPELGEASRDALRAIMRFGTPGNPLDLTGQVIGDATLLREVISVLEADDAFDLILFAIPTWTDHDAQRLIPVITGAAEASQKLAVVSAWSARQTTERVDALLAAAQVPTFGHLDAAMHALRALVGLPAPGPPPAPAVEVHEKPTEWAAADVTEAQASLFFAEHGIPVPLQHHAADAADAARVAAELRPPLVAKQLCHGLIHKSDLGLVRIALPNAAAVHAAAADFAAIVRAHELDPAGVLVAEQVEGLEMIVGGVRDPDFGPLIMVGAGGVLAELFVDQVAARCPVDESRARELIARLRIGQVLAGYRSGSYDLGAFARLVARASEIFAGSPWLTAFDLNPVLVGRAGYGCHAVDASVVVVCR
jgi:acetate---CoA ligase (ADP-forming)